MATLSCIGSSGLLYGTCSDDHVLHRRNGIFAFSSYFLGLHCKLAYTHVHKAEPFCEDRQSPFIRSAGFAMSDCRICAFREVHYLLAGSAAFVHMDKSWLFVISTIVYHALSSTSTLPTTPKHIGQEDVKDPEPLSK